MGLAFGEPEDRLRAWRGGAGGEGPPRVLRKCSPPTPSAFALLTRPTLPATKPGPARVSHSYLRKSGKPDLRGREGRSGDSSLRSGRRKSRLLSCPARDFLDMPVAIIMPVRIGARLGIERRLDRGE